MAVLWDQEEAPWRRWLSCFVVVALAHAALAIGFLKSSNTPGLNPGQGAPMVVELAAYTAAPPAGASGTEGVDMESKPPEPLQEPMSEIDDSHLTQELAPEPEPEVSPELAQAEPEPRAKPKAERPEHQSAPGRPDSSSQRDAPQALATHAGEQQQARVASLRASWQGEVNAHLERHKRYPHTARSRREEGVATLRFKIDRRGKVLDSTLEQSSGFFLLDREVQSVLRRAQPLPEPPSDVKGEVLELVWQVEFAINF